MTPLVSTGQGDYRRDYYGDDDAEPTFSTKALVNEPYDLYHSMRRDFLTSRALAMFRRCPLTFRRHELGLVVTEDTPALLVGRALHTLVLQGRGRFEAEFAVGGPVNPRTGQPFGANTKAFAEWAAQQGKQALTDEQAALVERMAAMIEAHPVASRMLCGGVAEGVARATYCEIPCQARVDYVVPRAHTGIVELKTTESLDWFEAEIRRYQYVHQLAFYRAVLALASGVGDEVGKLPRGGWLEIACHVVAVEKDEPHRVGVWRVSGEALAKAQHDNEVALHELAECRASGVWPTRYEGVRVYE